MKSRKKNIALLLLLGTLLAGFGSVVGNHIQILWLWFILTLIAAGVVLCWQWRRKERKKQDRKDNEKHDGKDMHASTAISADPFAFCESDEETWLMETKMMAEQAIAEHTSVITQNPNDADAYRRRAFEYEHLEAYEQAIADYSRAIELNPNSALLYNKRGDVYYYDLGMYEQAIADYAHALELEPGDPNNYEVLCWFGSLAGFAHDERVKGACDNAVMLALDNEYYRDCRGLNRALRGDYPGAIEDFQAIVRRAEEESYISEFIEQRQAWIAALQRGENPFDEATRNELRMD
jgi:tetratricopeptide (TPR) repeat protein